MGPVSISFASFAEVASATKAEPPVLEPASGWKNSARWREPFHLDTHLFN